MDKVAQVKRKLKAIVGANPNLPIYGKVTAIDGESCSVMLSEGLEISDVRLKATINGADNYVLEIPAIDSTVLMLSSDGTLDSLTVIKSDRLDKIEIIQNGLQFILDGKDQKIQIKNDKISLYDLFDGLQDVLKNMRVFTSTGASGLPLPPVILKIAEFEKQFKQLLKSD